MARQAELKKTIAPEAAKAQSAYDINADAALSEAPLRADFVWIDDAIPTGSQPPGKWSVELRRQT